MGESNGAVSDFDRIIVGGIDGSGRMITKVYAKQDGRYAVYQTSDGVIVLYAEDPLLQRMQRRNIATLARIRSEINGALASWRKARSWFRLRDAAARCDEMVSAALVEALEGHAAGGADILARVADEISADRRSRARIYYMLCTLIVATAFIGVCLVALGVVPSRFSAASAGALSLWYSVTAGVLGSVYSMALGIDRRDVTNDRRWADHLTDALVRICIGALAAFFLGNFLLTGAVRISFGSAGSLEGGAAGASWHVFIIAGFLAGFAERLVPNLLNSYSISKGGGSAAGDTSKSAEAGLSPSAAPAPADTAAASAKPLTEDDIVATPSDEEHVDGCDVDLAEPETLTRDEDLPGASGGVERR